MKNSLQIIVIGILSLFFSISSFSQNDNYYKPILDNGYTWVSLNKPLSVATDSRYSYLVSLLQSNFFKKQDQSNNDIIDCEEDIANLNESLPTASKIDLDYMVKMIDEFYGKKENLIIPVLGAYCCSVKKLAGVSPEEIEKYRNKLLEYSTK